VGRVEGETVQTVPGQDAVHGERGQAQDRADAGRAELAVLAQVADVDLDRRRRAVRRPVRPAGAYR